jgi:hypothetical protein
MGDSVCLGGYNPNRPRIGYRVTTCNTLYTGASEITTPEQSELIQQQYKGNILQYKGNSSNYSQNMIYAKIAQGHWINCKTPPSSRPNFCFSTSCSDVPGKEMKLCYKSTTASYYPKTKRVMTDVGGGFAINSKNLRCFSANGIKSEASNCP